MPSPAAATTPTAARASATTCTGRNASASLDRRVPPRTLRRHSHSSARLTSCRRATSAKQAPGCSASATIRSLSSGRQRRRRSTPVMISMASALTDARKNVRKCRSQIHLAKAELAGRILYIRLSYTPYIFLRMRGWGTMKPKEVSKIAYWSTIMEVYNDLGRTIYVRPRIRRQIQPAFPG